MSYPTASANGTDTITIYNTATTASECNQHILCWVGLDKSWADGYEQTTAVGADNTDNFVRFEIDSSTYSNQISWGNQHRFWIRVTPAGGGRGWNFYYRWTGQYPSGWPDYEHIDCLTGQFEPILRDQELAPETFMKWLERLGHDEAFCRMQYRMQKKMMKETGHLPPWDPRKAEQLEEERQRFMEHWRGLLEEDRASLDERMMERWGIEEIPSMTPELLDQIAESSRKFLEECLSPEELKYFDEQGHLKIRSAQHPNIYYIVKINDTDRVQRYINEVHLENICIHSKWAGLPIFDTVAMKVLYIKHAEEEFLKIGNRSPLRAQVPMIPRMTPG